MEFIDLKTQYRKYKREIDEAIHAVLDCSNYILGQQTLELEALLAEFVGVRHCVTVSSGTDSLLVALMALDIGPGDEVITVPFTWISPAQVIKLAGAKVVFVDIDPEIYAIAVDQVEEAITPRTKAIMPVSLYGQMPDYGAINSIAGKYDIPVIEDGAQSFGATQNGRRSCGVTTVGCTSFYPAKPLGCYGDGGAVFTDDDTLANKMRAMRNHGGLRRDSHIYMGINARFDTIQAAVLLAKWPYFEEELQARERIGRRYTALLKDCCTVPLVKERNTHVYAQYTVRVAYRNDVAETLKRKGIPTAIHYTTCNHEQPAFADLGYGKGSFPVAEQAAQEVLSLPMHPWLGEEEQDYIIDAVKESVLVSV